MAAAVGQGSVHLNAASKEELTRLADADVLIVGLVPRVRVVGTALELACHRVDRARELADLVGPPAERVVAVGA